MHQHLVEIKNPQKPRELEQRGTNRGSSISAYITCLDQGPDTPSTLHKLCGNYSLTSDKPKLRSLMPYIRKLINGLVDCGSEIWDQLLAIYEWHGGIARGCDIIRGSICA